MYLHDNPSATPPATLPDTPVVTQQIQRTTQTVTKAFWIGVVSSIVAGIIVHRMIER